jgi:hypothetical protein
VTPPDIALARLTGEVACPECGKVVEVLVGPFAGEPDRGLYHVSAHPAAAEEVWVGGQRILRACAGSHLDLPELRTP